MADPHNAQSQLDEPRLKEAVPASSPAAETNPVCDSWQGVVQAVLGLVLFLGAVAMVHYYTPTTAHSATSGCEASTSSIPPVERRCPATLMMSSVRLITHR